MKKNRLHSEGFRCAWLMGPYPDETLARHGNSREWRILLFSPQLDAFALSFTSLWFPAQHRASELDPLEPFCLGFWSLTSSPNAASEAFWRQRGAEQRGRHCELKTKSIDSAGLKYGINRCGIYCELCEAYNLLLGLVCVCVSMWLCNRHSYHREWCWGVKVELKQQPLG